MEQAPAPIRLSVRGLVAFSVCPPDIMPFSPSLMEEGRLAHTARQLMSAGKSEVPLSWQGTRRGIAFFVSGRMDLYEEETGLIEEIKLAGEPPDAPREEHLLQAMCYAHMLCCREGLPNVTLRVTYADTEGRMLASFDRAVDPPTAKQAFFTLLDAYAAFESRMRRHRARRDLSIASLPFPYPAYRAGQREMAAQVYTAIVRKKRLFASMPTGTGKSAAVLYPALKALGLQHCEQVFCLTARTTARLAMEQELTRMRGQGLVLKALTLNARERVCPQDEVRCHPEHCPRAKGHYERQPDALQAAMRLKAWDTDSVLRLSDRFALCPFELSLALSTMADVVIGDYNYAFDPRVRLQRVFERPRGLCVLADEAHNLPDRVRDMLSGTLEGSAVRDFRRGVGKALGRRHALYTAATALLRALRADAAEPAAIGQALAALLLTLRQHPHYRVVGNTVLDWLGFQAALDRMAAEPESYEQVLDSVGGEPRLKLLCLDFTPYLNKATARFHGFVCYSATMSPLAGMRRLLGGEEDDASFELPSPFPPEHLLCLQLPVDTRFNAREQSLPRVAAAIRAVFAGRPGKYIAFFPSYRYLSMAAQLLCDLPLHPQQGRMDEAARRAYLARFTEDGEPLLALAVMGGIFSEGVDLPGLFLIGVCVVGVGLPQVGAEREAIRRRAQAQGLSGFDIAYRYPGMHKVLQAAGRLIRSEHDRGVLALLDERFAEHAYRALMPPHWQVRSVTSEQQLSDQVTAFWRQAADEGFPLQTP